MTAAVAGPAAEGRRLDVGDILLADWGESCGAIYVLRTGATHLVSDAACEVLRVLRAEPGLSEGGLQERLTLGADAAECAARGPAIAGLVDSLVAIGGVAVR